MKEEVNKSIIKENEAEYDILRLENQLCFPLYAASKEVVKQYKPLLDDIGLTYTQYITMLVLWEYGELNVKSLGEYLMLDSGTMTPVVKKLESMELLERRRLPEDERQVIVKLTEKGEQLKSQAVSIPQRLSEKLPITYEEAKELYRLLYKVLKKD